MDVNPCTWTCPEEISLSIFQRLSLEDLSQVTAVCRLFHHIAEDEQMWRSLCHYDFEVIETDSTWKQTYQALHEKKQAEQLYDHFVAVAFNYHSNPSECADDYMKTKEKLFAKLRISEEKELASCIFRYMFNGWLEASIPFSLDREPHPHFFQTYLIMHPKQNLIHYMYMDIHYFSIIVGDLLNSGKKEYLVVSIPKDLDVINRREDFFYITGYFSHADVVYREGQWYDSFFIEDGYLFPKPLLYAQLRSIFGSETPKKMFTEELPPMLSHLEQ